ncbi:TonB-dependent receptor [Sphingosinicellaceae bacterium]|nr:TonB-dependent receptor [Sphingosinicellaceae bacterium]
MSAFLCTAAHAETQPSAVIDDDIVVSANKRSERLIDVPAPVTALGADQLARTQAVRLEDFAAQVPGLNLIVNRPGETQIVLRGITTGSPISSTVAVYIDDTPYGSSTTQARGGSLSPDLDPSDIERIEVLRGPQGSLYGASALGGLVKYVSKSPDLKDAAGRIEVGGNTVSKGGEGYSARGMINLPIISDKLALRVSGYDRRDAGFIDDTQLGVKDINKTDVYGGRAALLWRPSDQLSIDLTATLQNLKGDGSSEEDIVIAGKAISARTGELEHARFTFEPRKAKYRLYGGTIDYDLGGAKLVSVTSYSTLVQHAVADQTYQSGALLGVLLGAPGVGFSVGDDIDLSKVTQEVRLQSDTSGPLEWRIGGFYTHERVNRHQPSRAFFYASQATIPLPAPVYFADLYSKYAEYAGFGDLTYHLTESLSLSAGLRYSTNDQQYHQTTGGLAVGPTASLASKSSDDSVTYQVSAKYKLDSDNMIYARVASGYRPGGPNAVTPALIAAGVPAEFGPDKLTNYDIGYKASLLDRTLTLDLSAFYIDWKDIQILTNFGGFTSAGNGGTARSYGFEASAAWKPVTGLNLSGNVAYTDATLTQAVPSVSGVDGDRLPSVPRWAGGLSADYDFPLSDTIGAYVGGGFHAIGARRSGFATGSPAIFSRPVMPGYTTVDLRAGVVLGGYSLSVYARNVGDKRGLNFITSLNNNAYSAPYTASVIQPRTIGVSFVANF